MNIIKKTVFIFFLLIMIGCREKSLTENSNSSFEILVEASKSEEKDFSEIFSKPIYIQLETNDKCLLKWIHKVQIYKNKIYIFNSDDAGKLYCFNMEGKYLFSIGQRGLGPGEYVYLTDFAIDQLNNCIWLGDDARKILKYDLEGNLIQQYSTDFSIKNLMPLQDHSNFMAIRLGYYKDHDYSLIVYSTTDKKIIYHKKASNQIDKIIAANTFSTFNNNLLYAGGFNDTIFSVTKNGLNPYCFINFGKNSVPKAVLEDPNNKSLIYTFLQSDNKYAGLISNIIENDHYLLFRYDFAGNGQLAIYSKEKKQVINLNNISLNDKSFDASKYFFKFYENNMYISFLSAHLLTENDNNDDRINYGSYSDMDQLILNLRESDNPVLIFDENNFDKMF